MDAYFYHPQLPKKKLVKADIKQLSPKTNWEVLMKIEGIQALFIPGWTSCSWVRSKRVNTIAIQYPCVGKKYQNFDIHSFNLHPEKWFEMYPVKSNHIFIGCHLRFFRVVSTQNFFRVLVWFFLIYKYDTQLFSTCNPIWVEPTLKKSQVVPY